MDKFKNLRQEETPPKPSAMINTFRAFGYNLQTAIADIIDNSISAGAKNVWINYLWNGKDSKIIISDDGVGMNLEELIIAMTPGSKDPNEEREENDLGRFGLGLKTSSFSQCKRLTVASKKEGFSLVYRCWDLDFVNETKKWTLLEYISDESLIENLNKSKAGTVIIWECLDRLVGLSNRENEAAERVFLEEFENVEHHLSLVFHRYIDQKKLNIFLNQNKLEPWDPFLKETEGGQLIARERLENDNVEVKCYLLPHVSKLSETEREKYRVADWYGLQGFYIYRNNRLLLHGSWLGLFPKNEHYKNARILIDIPNKLDHDWKIDIKKATATPSISIRKELKRLGKLTRINAGKIHRFRGNQVILEEGSQNFPFQSVWKAKKTRDETRHYFINPEHPFIKSLLEKKSGIEVNEFKKALKIIGETTPVEAIIQYQSEEPDCHELRGNYEEPESYTIELAQEMFKSLVKTGVSEEIAIKQIFNIEPFNHYPQLIEYLK